MIAVLPCLWLLLRLLLLVWLLDAVVTLLGTRPLFPDDILLRLLLFRLLLLWCRFDDDEDKDKLVVAAAEPFCSVEDDVDNDDEEDK